MAQFKIVEHAADAGVTAFGETIELAFANAAIGMFSLMSDLTSVEEKESIELKIVGNNYEELLFNFLDDLLYRFEVHNFLAKRVEVRVCTKRLLEATAFGEEKDKSHHIKREIKSVTYHKLKVEQPAAGGWKAQIIFDI